MEEQNQTDPVEEFSNWLDEHISTGGQKEAEYNEAFHNMMDTLMDDDQRISFDELMKRVEKQGYGPYTSDRLRQKIRDSKSDESGEGFSVDLFNGKWVVERYV